MPDGGDKLVPLLLSELRRLGEHDRHGERLTHRQFVRRFAATLDAETVDRTGDLPPVGEPPATQEWPARFSKADPRQARPVELRGCGGLSFGRTTEGAGIWLFAAKCDWTAAESWLAGRPAAGASP